MKRRMGIKGKLLASFLGFSVIILALLWVLEVVFLDEVYEAMKIRSVHTASDRFYGMSDEEAARFAKEQAESMGLCTSLYDGKIDIVAREHASGRCVVHGLNRNTAALLYETTRNCEGKQFESHLPAEEVASILRKSELSKDFFREYVFGGREDLFFSEYSDRSEHDCILFGRIIENDRGEERYLLLSAVLVPVSSTVLTIRLELILVSIALVFVSLLMAYFLSRSISRPIVDLNVASKSLPEGRFDGKGASGYREIEELSQSLSRAAEEILQVDHFRKELLANVSHDLRTPLTLISGYSEVMRDIPGENTPENLQTIIDETHRLSELVNDLMDLSKMEAGMNELKTESVELVGLVRSICDRYEKMTGFRGIDLNLVIGVEQARVSADPVKLNQVIYNLINNAINYCGKDHFVGIRISQVEGYALVEVIDHGEGIPPEKLEHIWDRYYRVDQNHKSAAVGSGLGLSIAKKILELHGARFGVESKLGFGSRFWFALKLEP